jgi:hypothetical protein
MAELYGGARTWDLVAEVVARPEVPAAAATGLRRTAVAAVAATALLLAANCRVGTGSPPFLALNDAGAMQFTRAMYQTLQDLPGLPWPVLSDSVLRVASLLCLALAAFGCCFALLRVVVRLAAVDPVGLALAALLIGVGSLGSGGALLSGAALPGGGLGAAQVATALVALSLACALDGALVAALGLLGVAFDAEAAVALWGVAAVAGVSVARLREGVPIGRSWLAGGVCALLLAAPSAVWWGREIAGGGNAPVDYLGWLGVLQPQPLSPFSLPSSLPSLFPSSLPFSFPSSLPSAFPSAFPSLFPSLFPWALPLQRWVLLGSAVVLGLAACSVLGWQARAARGAFAGLLAVVALGCGLPWLTDDPWLLVLHPLAADSLLQLLAAAVATAVVLRDLREGGGVLRVALSVAIAVCLLLHRYLLPLAALAMLARAAAAHGEMLGLERRIRGPVQARLCRAAVAVVVLMAMVGGAVHCLLPPP